MTGTLYKANGNIYTPLRQNNNFMLLSGQTKGGYKFFEVWAIRHAKKDMFISGALVRREGDLIKPSNEDFGMYAWCFSNYEKALRKFSA